MKTIVRVLAVLVIVIISLFGLKRLLGLEIYRMLGDLSMYPTLKKGTYMVVRMDPDPGKLERGDIAMVSNRKEPDGYLWTKRIIAVPGDTIQIVDDDVYLNHNYLEEPYVYFQNGKTGNEIEVILNDGEYFVMGDNRNNSIDSRQSEYGVLKTEEFKGVLVLRLSL